MKESRFQVPTPLRAREAAKPSRAMASTNEINAKNLVKKADGFMKPSMLRWKPDFDKAIELYEEAARAYRGSNNFVMAADAEERSAEAHTRLDDYWHAAKALERGTEALARCEPIKGEAVLAMAERACGRTHWRIEGRRARRRWEERRKGSRRKIQRQRWRY